MMKRKDDLQETLEQLSWLTPSEQEQPVPARQMLSRIKQEVDQTAESSGSSFWSTLYAVLFAPSRRWAVTAVMLLALFTVGFNSPTMRAAASSFLGQFRVQKFAAISISPDQLAVLEQIAESGLTPGKLTFDKEPGAGKPVHTIHQAAVLTGDDVLTLPQLGDPDTIYVTDGGSALFHLDLESSRKILEFANIDPNLLPAEMANGDIRIFMYDGVLQSWSDGTAVVQTASPVVEYPNGVDPTLLGSALLQLLGLSADEASRLAQQIDWTSTLVLPVPTNVGTFEEVTVQGVSGLFISALGGGDSGLMWQKDDMIYVLTSQGDAETLIGLAEGLK